MRRPALVILMLLLASPAAAQNVAPPPVDRPDGVEFLPRAAFRLGAEHLSGSDERFVWDADLGGEIDLVDYGKGRATFLANYQVVLGDELRQFDPNQGNYILSGSASVRLARLEVAGVFYHQSRHLSDRRKVAPVDWNMVGGRVQAVGSSGPVRIDGRLDVRKAIQKSFVDYTWELDGGVRTQYRLGPAAALISGADLRLLGVDDSQGRERQTGFRVEGGVRLEGAGAAIELFIGAERRIDPHPLDFGTETWFLSGFRLMSR